MCVCVSGVGVEVEVGVRIDKTSFGKAGLEEPLTQQKTRNNQNSALQDLEETPVCEWDAVLLFGKEGFLVKKMERMTGGRETYVLLQFFF